LKEHFAGVAVGRVRESVCGGTPDASQELMVVPLNLMFKPDEGNLGGQKKELTARREWRK
jgi:hypothetical protein